MTSIVKVKPKVGSSRAFSIMHCRLLFIYFLLVYYLLIYLFIDLLIFFFLTSKSCPIPLSLS